MPKFSQDLKERVAKLLEPGDCYTKRELADELDYDPATVGAAVNQLVAEGRVSIVGAVGRADLFGAAEMKDEAEFDKCEVCV